MTQSTKCRPRDENTPVDNPLPDHNVSVVEVNTSTGNVDSTRPNVHGNTCSLSMESLDEWLFQGLEAEHVEVEDTTPGHCSTSFKVLVISPRLREKPQLQRHWLVNEVLAEELKHTHASEP
ncbi:UNVERIFIED_CONTAM: hypothetical protein K2H54_040069 [Gekko kuhli]